MIGGLEVLPFGLLVFVLGGLVLANAWAVVDAKLTVGVAAREAGRTYVEATDRRSAPAESLAAARDVLRSSGRDPGRLGLHRSGDGSRRCAVVETEATYRLPAVSLPFVGGFGHTTVHGRHRDVVDPFTSGRSGTCA